MEIMPVGAFNAVTTQPRFADLIGYTGRAAGGAGLQGVS